MCLLVDKVELKVQKTKESNYKDEHIQPVDTLT